VVGDKFKFLEQCKLKISHFVKLFEVAMQVWKFPIDTVNNNMIRWSEKFVFLREIMISVFSPVILVSLFEIAEGIYDPCTSK